MHLVIVPDLGVGIARLREDAARAEFFSLYGNTTLPKSYSKNGTMTEKSHKPSRLLPLTPGPNASLIRSLGRKSAAPPSDTGLLPVAYNVIPPALEALENTGGHLLSSFPSIRPPNFAASGSSSILTTFDYSTTANSTSLPVSSSSESISSDPFSTYITLLPNSSTLSTSPSTFAQPPSHAHSFSTFSSSSTSSSPSFSSSSTPPEEASALPSWTHHTTDRAGAILGLYDGSKIASHSELSGFSTGVLLPAPATTCVDLLPSSSSATTSPSPSYSSLAAPPPTASSNPHVMLQCEFSPSLIHPVLAHTNEAAGQIGTASVQVEPVNAVELCPALATGLKCRPPASFGLVSEIGKPSLNNLSGGFVSEQGCFCLDHSLYPSATAHLHLVPTELACNRSHEDVIGCVGGEDVYTQVTPGTQPATGSPTSEALVSAEVSISLSMQMSLQTTRVPGLTQNLHPATIKPSVALYAMAGLEAVQQHNHSHHQLTCQPKGTVLLAPACQTADFNLVLGMARLTWNIPSPCSDAENYLGDYGLRTSYVL
ncbi:unnamed protein product [Protopolystoma xenopodis]|uniref:Uncharacterized protein n=1 Tax=Protopolystoma xenopodis TaxID=117903 RepID=A0A3S5A8L3_9PLAT|nr:unnamed protein product [Protopolystoma xenopodis]